MGKLIKFPTHRVVHNNPNPIRPELSEEEARQIKEDKFVEQITESLILDIQMQDGKVYLLLQLIWILLEPLKSLKLLKKIK